MIHNGAESMNLTLQFWQRERRLQGATLSERTFWRRHASASATRALTLSLGSTKSLHIKKTPNEI